MVTTFTPFFVLPLFMYDRRCFMSERSAALYPPSAYFMARITLEVVFSALSGAIFGSMLYRSVEYQSYIQADDPTVAMLGFVGIVSIMFVLANVRLCLIMEMLHVITVNEPHELTPARTLSFFGQFPLSPSIFFLFRTRTLTNVNATIAPLYRRK